MEQPDVLTGHLFTDGLASREFRNAMKWFVRNTRRADSKHFPKRVAGCLTASCPNVDLWRTLWWRPEDQGGLDKLATPSREMHDVSAETF